MHQLIACHESPTIQQNGFAKHGIIDAMITPVYLGDYTRNTHATKFTYEVCFCLYLYLYQDYKEHMRNSVNAFTEKFKDNLFIDSEDPQGLIVGYTATQIYKQVKTNFLLPQDIA